MTFLLELVSDLFMSVGANGELSGGGRLLCYKRSLRKSGVRVAMRTYGFRVFRNV